MKQPINNKAFFISNVYDETNNSKSAIYKFKVDETGNYKLSCNNATKVCVYNKNFKLIEQATNEMIICLNKNQFVFVEINTLNKKEKFYLNFEKIDRDYTTSYELKIEDNGKNIPLFSSESVDPLKPSLIKMKKRKGGSYIYCNVPESMPLEAINSIIMQNKDLSGECFFTCEHSNRTGLKEIYLGYRIVNKNKHDIYVTVKNVGYQVEGSWLGEKSWIDYYGIPCTMDCSNFKKEDFEYAGKTYNAHDWFKDYLGFDTNYKPNPIKPTTYKIPSGKYLYVIGGTSEDAYNNINVNNTANLPLKLNHCANANVLFNVYNGKAVGEFCAYTDVKKINSKKVVIPSKYNKLPVTGIGEFAFLNDENITKIVIPANISTFINSLKVNIGLSLVGVISGEFLISKAGLGYLIVYGGQVFKLDLVMASNVVLCVLAALMYFAVTLLEKCIIKYKP